MLTILDVKVYDLFESVIASGNAMRLEPVEYTQEEFQKGLKRMARLVKTSQSGNIHCHDNALTGIRVSIDLKYPQYWSMEFQRYHFADIVTSSSKMHRLCKMDLSRSCNQYVDSRVLEVMREKVEKYNQEQTYENFMNVISNCPMGLELFMRVSTNYKQLQTIYFQRKNHKLQEDWGVFCKMIEDLPYFKELILGEYEEDQK